MRNQEEHIKGVAFNEGVTIIRLAGSINYDNLKVIQDEFAAKTNGKKVENILFDVGEVADADTAGVAALIDLLRYMKTHQAGDKIGLINVSVKIKNLLSISKTQPLFNEYPSEEEAIKNLM